MDPLSDDSDTVLVASTRLSLVERRPVWSALSNLFLDTDVSALREANARQLAASPYSIAELQRILVHEVYPVCRSNLFGWPGGEWLAFDEEWLQTRILRRLRSPFRPLHWMNLGRLSVHASWEWRRTKARIRELRSGNGTPASQEAG